MKISKIYFMSISIPIFIGIILFTFLVLPTFNSNNDNVNIMSFVLHTISILLPILITVIVLSIIFIPMMKEAKTKQRLQENGVRAFAKILSIRMGSRIITSGLVHRNLEVIMEVEITPQVGGPFRASLKELIPELAIPQIQPGNTLKVVYDSQNHSLVTLDSTTE